MDLLAWRPDRPAAWGEGEHTLIEIVDKSTFDIILKKPAEPLLTIRASGVTPVRSTIRSDERLDYDQIRDLARAREDALIAHTRKNAYFVFQENTLGSIQPGKLADMVVIDRDYLTVPADQIKDIRPVITMVGGRVVYDAAAPEALAAASEDAHLHVSSASCETFGRAIFETLYGFDYLARPYKRIPRTAAAVWPAPPLRCSRRMRPCSSTRRLRRTSRRGASWPARRVSPA